MVLVLLASIAFKEGSQPMDSGGIIIEVDGSHSHVFLNRFYPWDVVFSISIEHFRFLHFGSLSQEDRLWLFGDTVLLILLLEFPNKFGYLIPQILRSIGL
jgi:hypothetical protein